jgi:hypothetical protein
MTGSKLNTAAAAKLAGVQPGTWRSWRSTGRPRPEPVPPPDGWYELRTPWWYESTITDWLRKRRSANSSNRKYDA